MEEVRAPVADVKTAFRPPAGEPPLLPGSREEDPWKSSFEPPGIVEEQPCTDLESEVISDRDGVQRRTDVSPAAEVRCNKAIAAQFCEPRRSSYDSATTRHQQEVDHYRLMLALAESIGGLKKRLCAAVASELDLVNRELVGSSHRQPATHKSMHEPCSRESVMSASRESVMSASAHPNGIGLVRASMHTIWAPPSRSSKPYGRSICESLLNPVRETQDGQAAMEGHELNSSERHPPTSVEDEAADESSTLFGKMPTDGSEVEWELLPYWISPNCDVPDNDSAHSSMVAPSAAEMMALQWTGPGTNRKFIDPDGPLSDEDYAFSVSQSWIARLMISPFNLYKVAWDMGGMMLIAYDTLCIPLQFFELDDMWFTIFMTWLAMIFWLLDIPLTFLTGVCDFSTSRVEMRPSKVAPRYLKTWFVLDVIVVLPDWLIFFLSNDSGGVTRLGKVVRALRALRALRLLRLAKLRKMFHTFQNRLNNEYLVCYLQLIKLMVSIAVLNHILACCWYGVSSLEEEDRGWVVKFEYDEGNDRAFQYLTSLHWALCIFQGSMEVHPGTTSERLFAVIVQFVGLIIVSYFISSITHFMTEIRVIHTNKLQRRSHLIRYLCQKNISPELSVRIKQFADKVARTETTSEEEVEILRELPEEMKKDLDLELKGPALGVHPLINNLVWNNKRLALEIVDHVTQVSMHYSEVLFRRGEESALLFVAMSGRLVYDKDPNRGATAIASLSGDGHPINAFRPVQVTPNDWLCEMALWTHWTHRGVLTARAHCEVFGILRERLAEITSQLKDDMAKIVYNHARVFIDWLNNQVRKNVDDLSHMPHGIEGKKRGMASYFSAAPSLN